MSQRSMKRQVEDFPNVLCSYPRSPMSREASRAMFNEPAPPKRPRRKNSRRSFPRSNLWQWDSVKEKKKLVVKKKPKSNLKTNRARLPALAVPAPALRPETPVVIDDVSDSDSDWPTISEEMDRMAEGANGDVLVMSMVLPGVNAPDKDCSFNEKDLGSTSPREATQLPIA